MTVSMLSNQVVGYLAFTNKFLDRPVIRHFYCNSSEVIALLLHIYVSVAPMSSRERISLEKIKVEIGECLVIYWRPEGILSRNLPFELVYNSLFLIELNWSLSILIVKFQSINLFYLNLKLISDRVHSWWCSYMVGKIYKTVKLKWILKQNHIIE